MKTIAELVDDLFKTHRRSDGKEYTYQEITIKLGGAIDPSHLSKLRNGRIANPGRDSLLALCRFFQVPPSYFFPELAEHEEGYEEESSDPVESALRSTVADPDIRESLRDLIRKLSKQ